MKTKNNYSKLRSQKNSLQNRLNKANKNIKLQIYEIKRYSNALLLEQKANRILENKINLVIKQKTIALRRLEEANRQKDSYYDWYVKEIDKKNKTENKLIIGITILMFVITALTIIKIKG